MRLSDFIYIYIFVFFYMMVAQNTVLRKQIILIKVLTWWLSVCVCVCEREIECVRRELLRVGYHETFTDVKCMCN